MMEHTFLFYVYDVDQIGPINVHNDALIVGICLIDTNAPDYYSQTADKYNDLLPEFLKAQNIHQFIPLKKPSMEIMDDIVTICYYHNLKAYNIIYKLYPNYICYPNHIVECELNDLYYSHGLNGWYDSRSNPL